MVLGSHTVRGLFSYVISLSMTRITAQSESNKTSNTLRKNNPPPSSSPGTHIDFPSATMTEWMGNFDPHVINDNAFRAVVPIGPMHLRSMKRFVLDSIPRSEFQVEGDTGGWLSMVVHFKSHCLGQESREKVDMCQVCDVMKKHNHPLLSFS